MERQTKTKLEKMLIGIVAATAICLAVYNAEPIAKWLKETYNKESISQLGADITAASQISRYQNIFQ